MDNQQIKFSGSPTPPMQNPILPETPKSRFNLYLILLAIIFVLLIGAGGFYLGKNYKITTPTVTQPKEKPCTLEVKICPDGSSVGRTGPNCEFVPCPTPVDQIANWKIYSDKVLSVSFKYPNAWDASAQASGSDYYISIKNFVTKSVTASLEKKQIAIFITEGLRDLSAHSVKIKGINTIEKLTIELSQDKNVRTTTEQKTLEINGYKALSRMTTYQTNPDKSVEEIYILDGKGKIIIITYDGDVSSFRNIFDQILSTFKFIDEEIDWRDAQRRASLHMLQTALELYYSVNNFYPDTKGDPQVALLVLIDKKYLLTIPNDLSGRTYYYEFSTSDNGYILCAAMEKNSPEISDTTTCQNHDCGGFQCNFEVKNPK